MKIAVYGAGAIGGLLAAHLAKAGCQVTAIARGAHLSALRRDGIKIIASDGEFTAKVEACENPGELGAQDFVIVALKAHSVPGVAAAMRPMLGPKSAVVMAVNGIPWWYFHGLEGELRDRRLPIVDPGDAQWREIGPERAIGCVVYPAAEIVAPGTVKHVEGDRFTLGEPSGEMTERVRALAKAMIAGGLKAPIKPDIRTEIWVKLWGNVALNPVSALTGATLRQMCEDPETRAIIRAIMVEVEAVARKLGVKMPIDVDRRIEGARQVGDHKTSMLQDFERGRAIELDAIVGAVMALGAMVDCPTPNIGAIYALTRMKAKLAGLYPG